MNIYEIYVDNKQNDISPQLLKNGSSLLAAFITPFWALYHKMWLLAAFTIVLSMVIYYLKSNANTAYLGLLGQLFCILFFGIFASDIRITYLKSQGYALQDIIMASSEEEAELKFYAKQQLLSSNHEKSETQNVI